MIVCRCLDVPGHKPSSLYLLASHSLSVSLRAVSKAVSKESGKVYDAEYADVYFIYDFFVTLVSGMKAA
jgi:hypothetical protein